jgi:poly(hydroxyalkanoate) depolymerase family esterase
MSDNTNARLNRRTVLKTIGGAAVATGVIGSVPAVGAAAGSYTSEDYNGRYYGKYVPSTYDGSESVPILMMMHGCTQSADGFKSETQMNQVAEDNNFIVVYPEQTTGFTDCWQWFNDANTTRGSGEAAEMAGIIDQEKSRENINGQRVYVAGFSAGAAFVPNLVAEYADVFAAGGIHSGTMYDVAESQTEGNSVITDCSAGTSTDPQVEGRHAYDRMKQFDITSEVPTIVFHGTSDYTVSPCNGEEAAEQACVTNDLALDGADDGGVDYTADTTNTGSGDSLTYTEYEYHDPNGNAIVEHYVVDGMGHAWSGGAQGGSYTAPGGPEASQIIWEFFSNWRLNSSAGGGSGGGGGDNNSAPTASVNASDTSVQTGETVTFDGSNSADSDGTISMYEWDFGDGTTAMGETVSHSYSSTGNYTVTLTVTDNAGATDTSSETISVSGGSFSGYCGTANNYTHVQAGRAYDSGGYAYAVGSNDHLGLNNTYYMSTLKETSEGYYKKVDTC